MKPYVLLQNVAEENSFNEETVGEMGTNLVEGDGSRSTELCPVPSLNGDSQQFQPPIDPSNEHEFGTVSPSIFPLYSATRNSLHQGLTGYGVQCSVGSDCGMSGALKVKQGFGPGVALGTVETPLQNTQCISKSLGNLPAKPDVECDALEGVRLHEEEVQLLEDELRIRRLKLEHKKLVHNRVTTPVRNPIAEELVDGINPASRPSGGLELACRGT